MDSYAINSTIDQGTMMTRDNMNFNERVGATRASLQSNYDAQSKVDATTRDRDKEIYEAHDTIQTLSTLGKVPVIQKSWASLKSSDNVGAFLQDQFDMAKELNPKFYSALGMGGKSKSPTESTSERLTESADTEMGRSDFGDVTLSLDDEGRVQGFPEEPAPNAVQSNPPTNETAVPTDEGTPAVSESTDLTEDTANAVQESVGEGSKLEEIAGKAIDTASKLAPAIRIAGNVGGYMDVAKLIANRGVAEGDMTHKVSEWAEGVGSLLDTVGFALPVLEPIGAALQLGGAIADSIDTAKADEGAVQEDGKVLNEGLKTQQYRTDVPLSNMGLIATQNNHIANMSSGGVGAF
tara:strand:+ start:386 stop:1438 length:1053 start_codon:yes stop_codon:yes gene_type:complete